MVTYLDPWTDIEADLVDWVKTLPGVTGAGNNTPANLEDRLPFVRISKMGGADDVITDAAAVDIDVFAPSLDGAKALAETIRARLVPRQRVGGSIIDSVRTNTSPRPLPWSTSTIKRVSATLSITRRR